MCALEYTAATNEVERGELCEEKLDFCAPELNPCQHDSKCILTPQGYKCECTPGYVGDQCELDYDDCEENKCQNGAQCIDAINGYTCVCPLGYSGLFCEFSPPMVLPRTSPCDDHECLNGAQCVVVEMDPRCQCLHGYEGEWCETLASVNFINRQSYLQLPSSLITPETNITLQIATDEDSGVLLYKGDQDHITIELYRGRLRASYHTGTHPPSAIYSVETVNDGVFHVHRLSSIPRRYARSLVSLWRCVWDAGCVRWEEAWGWSASLQSGAGGRNGSSFHGCLKNLYINGQLQDLGVGLEQGQTGVQAGCQPCQAEVVCRGERFRDVHQLQRVYSRAKPRRRSPSRVPRLLSRRGPKGGAG
ncbi:hypothetical protein J4Q44_G00386400 [Coregonus suidteri]|uniref:Uncharacterized protein n=1 Tax=Coregonus suidteri TaxID=861788 RepID=A0AAN8Q440_9TELE